MILFALGVLLGAGCLAVYNEMYTRWLYADVKRLAKEQGISDAADAGCSSMGNRKGD